VGINHQPLPSRTRSFAAVARGKALGPLCCAQPRTAMAAPCRHLSAPSLAPPLRDVAARRSRTGAQPRRHRAGGARASLVDSAVTMAEASLGLAALQLVRRALRRVH
jgi:hypothetical protein